MSHWMLVPMALFFHSGDARVADAIDSWPVHCARRSSVCYYAASVADALTIQSALHTMVSVDQRNLYACLIFCMDVSYFFFPFSPYVFLGDRGIDTDENATNGQTISTNGLKFQWNRIQISKQKANSENVKIQTIACILYANCEQRALFYRFNYFHLACGWQWWLYAHANNVFGKFVIVYSQSINNIIR